MAENPGVATLNLISNIIKYAREIKFRAWDSRYGCMYNWNELALEDEQVFITDGDLYRQYNDELHVMQYTGLKDKNGKEIYEGDVLTWSGVDRTAVTFSNGSFYTNNGTTVLGQTNWHKSKVIGNIYENPKLLEN